MNPRADRQMLRWLGVTGILVVAAMINALPAMADSVTYTTSLQSSNMCTGCGPFGTVTVSSVAGHPSEVSVSLTLTPGEVFANTGAGAALLFDVQGNPALTVSGLSSAFSFAQPASPIMADGSGQWNTEILCMVCGSGTGPPQDSGPINFILSVASGTLAPSSFVTNNKNVLFASDLGVPNGSGGFFTGDVVTKNGLTPVPIPAAMWLMISGLAGLLPWARKRRGA
jgi:hypothetical protein